MPPIEARVEEEREREERSFSSSGSGDSSTSSSDSSGDDNDISEEEIGPPQVKKLRLKICRPNVDANGEKTKKKREVDLIQDSQYQDVATKKHHHHHHQRRHSKTVKIAAAAAINDDKKGAEKSVYNVAVTHESTIVHDYSKTGPVFNKDRFKLGSGYFVQVGEINWNKPNSINFEGLVILRELVDRKPFRFNIPSKMIIPLRDAMLSIVQDEVSARAKKAE